MEWFHHTMVVGNSLGLHFFKKIKTNIWYTHNILRSHVFFDSAILNVPLFILNKPSVFLGKNHEKHLSHHDAKDITALKRPGTSRFEALTPTRPDREILLRGLSTNSDEPRAATEEVHRRVMNEVPNENANPTIAWFRGDPSLTLSGKLSIVNGESNLPKICQWICQRCGNKQVTLGKSGTQKNHPIFTFGCRIWNLVTIPFPWMRPGGRNWLNTENKINKKN